MEATSALKQLTSRGAAPIARWLYSSRRISPNSNVTLMKNAVVSTYPSLFTEQLYLTFASIPVLARSFYQSAPRSSTNPQSTDNACFAIRNPTFSIWVSDTIMILSFWTMLSIVFYIEDLLCHLLFKKYKNKKEDWFLSDTKILHLSKLVIKEEKE